MLAMIAGWSEGKFRCLPRRVSGVLVDPEVDLDQRCARASLDGME
jgi:hypothetical protein